MNISMWISWNSGISPIWVYHGNHNVNISHNGYTMEIQWGYWTTKWDEMEWNGMKDACWWNLDLSLGWEAKQMGELSFTNKCFYFGPLLLSHLRYCNLLLSQGAAYLHVKGEALQQSCHAYPWWCTKVWLLIGACFSCKEQAVLAKPRSFLWQNI